MRPLSKQLARIFFGPEYEDMLFRNIGWLSTNYIHGFISQRVTTLHSNDYENLKSHTSILSHRHQ
jgi:hypothetical protein